MTPSLSDQVLPIVAHLWTRAVATKDSWSRSRSCWTIGSRPPGTGDVGQTLAARVRSPTPAGDVIADPDRVGHHGQGRVDRADTWEDARVGEVEVVELMCLAVDVRYGGQGIGAETGRTGLMCHPGDGASVWASVPPPAP